VVWELARKQRTMWGSGTDEARDTPCMARENRPDNIAGAHGVGIQCRCCKGHDTMT
jgi:hypothetical protein